MEVFGQRREVNYPPRLNERLKFHYYNNILLHYIIDTYARVHVLYKYNFITILYVRFEHISGKSVYIQHDIGIQNNII